MKAKKSLGQNFLLCPWVSEKMLKAADLSASDTVLEIGPGRGALTKYLLRSGARVFAIEKDDELYILLKDKFKDEISKGQLVLYNADIKDIIKDKTFIKDIGDFKLVANIPYYITGEILRMFLGLQRRPVTLTLLVQYEVAKRVVSDKESLLSLSVRFYGEPKLVAKVGAKCFSPKPKVDSAILHIKTKSDLPYLELESKFFEVIRTGFASKRKKLINNLTRAYDKGKLKRAFEKFDIKDTARAEELPLKKWLDLAQALEEDRLK